MAKPAKKNSSQQMAQHLIGVLSDTYLLMIKTHGFHWNVTGALFPQLHTFFETQYTELFAAADEIAERVRALDSFAPGSAAGFQSETSIKESGNEPPSATAMLKDLLKSNEILRDRIETARSFADEIEDRATEDLMNTRRAVHDKAIWMIRSQLAG